MKEFRLYVTFIPIGLPIGQWNKLIGKYLHPLLIFREIVYKHNLGVIGLYYIHVLPHLLIKTVYFRLSNNNYRT